MAHERVPTRYRLWQSNYHPGRTPRRTPILFGKKRATAHYRRDIAALKRQVAQLTELVQQVRKSIPQPETPPPEIIQKARLRIDGLKTHRAKLGFSAKDYGKLLGVSGLTVYNWESGKSKPRRSQLPKLLSVRGIGKREAFARLGLNGSGSKDGSTPSKTAAPPQKRGRFRQTGEASILLLLKARKSLSTSGINEAWKKEGRGGTANVLLGKLVKARKVKRAKVQGRRGSEYRLA